MKLATESYQQRIAGKCIIAGEHAVIRGHPALIVPIESQYAEFTYQADDNPLTLQASFSKDSEFLTPFLAHALSFFASPPQDLQGRLTIRFAMATRSGLGASATLSVGLAYFFQRLGFLSEEELFPFALHLENYFHGESSGADIAAVLTRQPILFRRGDYRLEPIVVTWNPLLYLTHSQEGSFTSECVASVQKIWERNPLMAASIDASMAESVHLCNQALSCSDISLLQRGITQAANCFARWNLISQRMERKMEELLNEGALAAKPTGAGMGGFILTLWHTPPPELYRREMIPLFQAIP